MKKYIVTLGSFAVLASAFLFIQAKKNGTEDVQNEHNFHNSYKIFALNKPENLSFAGEKIDLNDPDIYEKLDREIHVNTYWQSNSILLIKRANKYFPIIEPILAKHGIPDDFKYLAVAESGLQNITSPAGAKGVWQIMKGTAKEYKLEVTETVDERYHLEKATEAACKYLLRAKKQLNNADWLTVAASYNMGIAGIRKQQTRQSSKHYLDLLLNPETARYVYRLAALKLILENPKDFGFNVRDKDMYHMVPSKTITIDTTVNNLGQFAKDFGINYKILKIHNPWLRDSFLADKTRKKYDIKIPNKGFYTIKH